MICLKMRNQHLLISVKRWPITINRVVISGKPTFQRVIMRAFQLACKLECCYQASEIVDFGKHHLFKVISKQNRYVYRFIQNNVSSNIKCKNQVI